MSQAKGTNSPPKRSIHPGSGRRRAPAFPKGRQLESGAREEVQAILGDRPRDRDLLIEHLHLIQDSQGRLSARHLQGLADEMSLPMVEVYEVASFYAHFDIVLDGETAPPPLTIRVCDSLTCEMLGARPLMVGLRAELRAELGESVRVVRAPCMGRCQSAPVAEVGHRHIDRASVESVAAAARSGDTHPEIPDYTGFDAYVAGGGYALLRDCLAGGRDRDEIVGTMEHSGLRGLGGAGFPSGLKWKLVRQQPRPRICAINGDEGEPGTFKDRHCLENDPHRFLEGMLVTGWTCETDTIYVYIRDEYPAALEILVREIARVEEEGLAGGMKIVLRRGAGAYICGEESAMFESIEGKRGLPRHKPPFPTEKGLFGLPTLAHNIETVYWVRDILEKGPDWFAAQGRNENHKGFRSYSVSGRVKEPGVKLAPAGITVKELIEEHCGGMAEGQAFKAYLPGGASGGILPARLGDLPLDFGGPLAEHGCFVGSHAVIVLSDKDDVKAAALNVMRFFEDESCGQCTPCRNGTEKAVKLMERGAWDRDLLADLSEVMRDASICGLGQAAPNPLDSLLKFFPEELT